MAVANSAFPATTLTGFIYAIPSNPSTLIDNIASLALLPAIAPSMAYSGFNELYTLRPIY